jgi:hypothetical protein
VSATGWPLALVTDLVVTPEPTAAELDVLRALTGKGTS